MTFSASTPSVQQRGQQCPVARLEPRLLSAQLALQHRDLVAQDEDLGVLVPIAHRAAVAGARPRSSHRGTPVVVARRDIIPQRSPVVRQGGDGALGLTKTYDSRNRP